MSSVDQEASDEKQTGVTGRQTDRGLMRRCEVIEFPRVKKEHLSAYHMMRMNFRPQRAGVRRDTFLKALNAEGVGAFPYGAAPITQWRRRCTVGRDDDGL
ncbi:MAG: hypothetical protein AMK75_03580 [Planctomycetes bacterium SM23_65]|nr:MAG: hypothetical protein AMK75_03580 [Planctomycetes bacterium SM23_65]